MFAGWRSDSFVRSHALLVCQVNASNLTLNHITLTRVADAAMVISRGTDGRGHKCPLSTSLSVHVRGRPTAIAAGLRSNKKMKVSNITLGGLP